jgi:hypothetical protein
MIGGDVDLDMASVPATVVVEPPVTKSSKTYTSIIIGIIVFIVLAYFLYKYVYLPNKESNSGLPACDPNECSNASCNTGFLPNCNSSKCIPPTCPTLYACNPNVCHPSGCNPGDLPSCDPNVCIPNPCPVQLSPCSPNVCQPSTCNNTPLPDCDPTKCIPPICDTNAKLPACDPKSCYPSACNPGTLPNCDPNVCVPYDCPGVIDEPTESTEPMEPTTPTTPNLRYAITSKLAPNECLKASPNSSDLGSMFVTAPCDFGADEQFKWDSVTKVFKNPSGTRCLDLKSYGTLAGTPIIVQICNPNWANQRWTYDSKNRYINESANKCLQVNNNDICYGSNMIINDCNDLQSQQFGYINDAQTNDLKKPFPYTDRTYKFNHPDSGKCLRSPGEYSQIWSCENNPNEFWKFIDAGNGSYRIQTKDSNGTTKCLTNNVNSMSRCNDGDNDKWIINGDPRCNFSIKNVSNSQCLRSPGGAYMQMWDCDSSGAEKWKLTI